MLLPGFIPWYHCSHDNNSFTWFMHLVTWRHILCAESTAPLSNQHASLSWSICIFCAAMGTATLSCRYRGTKSAHLIDNRACSSFLYMGFPAGEIRAGTWGLALPNSLVWALVMSLLSIKWHVFVLSETVLTSINHEKIIILTYLTLNFCLVS